MDALVFENSSAENRELGALLRELGRLLRGDRIVDWTENRGRCADILQELAAGCEKSRSLSEQLSEAQYRRVGSEHIIIHLPNRVFKATFSDSLGCCSQFFKSDPDLTGKHFHATENASPFFYIERWMYLNSISTFQTQYEGILPPMVAGQLPLICVSQPALPPQSATRQNPTEGEIQKSLLPYGFAKICDDAFLNSETGILLTDAAPRNVRIVNGVPIPFDAIAEVVPMGVREWLAAM